MGADLETQREIQLQNVKDTYGASSKEYYAATHKGDPELTGYNDWRIETNNARGDAAGVNSTSGSTGTNAVRYRGSTSQTRVGDDTRVRSGTASSGSGQSVGDTGSGMAAALKSATGTQYADMGNVQPVESAVNVWSGKRAPTDLASVRQRVLKSVTGQ